VSARTNLAHIVQICRPVPCFRAERRGRELDYGARGAGPGRCTHPYVAGTMEFFAEVLDALGEAERAADMYQRAAAARNSAQ
jgi:hypothetical protein